MLGPDGVPLSRRYYSPESGKELDDDEMVRGYEIDKGKYVIVTGEDLERLEPEKSRDIDLSRFVKKEEIEPIYFERAYFLAPAGGSVKRSEEHTSELQSRFDLVCRLLLEKKNSG